MSNRKTGKPAIRTIFAQMNNGSLRKIEIPHEWVITFGPIAFAARNNGGESPNVLRIYSSKAKTSLMAVFRDVVSVTDASIVVTEKVIKKRQKVFVKKEDNGEQQYAAELRRTVWQNPYADEPDADENDFDESILSLPGGDDGIPI